MFGRVPNGIVWSRWLGVGGWNNLSCDVRDSTASSHSLCIGDRNGLSCDDKAQDQHEDQNNVKSWCEMHCGA